MTTATTQAHAAEVTVSDCDNTLTTPAEAPRCGGVGPSSHRHWLMCKPQSAAKHTSKPIRSPVPVKAYRHSLLTISDFTPGQHHRVTRYSFGEDPS